MIQRNRKQNLMPALLCLFLLAGLLGGCAQPQPVAHIPLFNETPQTTATPKHTTPVPTRPIYPPGTLVDYVTQSGDSLAVIAIHFNTSVKEILEANPLVQKDISTLQAGTALKIPIYYKALWGSQFQIIPDALFVNGPASIGFDAVEFVNSSVGWLKNYTAFAGDEMRTGGEVIDYVAQNFSISPRLLLAIAEYQTGALSQPQLNSAISQYPLGYEEMYHKGFYLQLVWAANMLNNGYYGWRSGSLTTITRIDGTLEVPDPWQNAATVAIQHYFAITFPTDIYTTAIYQDGLFKTYSDLFGDPWQERFQPVMPGNLRQPDLVLPFTSGHTWAYTGGPHAAWWGEGEPFAALDFAPPTSGGGCSPSSEFVVAMADGQIVRTEEAVAVLDLDADGDERTGWVIYYLHLGLEDMVAEGRMVRAGDPIGHPSCEGGAATGTHVHVARKYNGEWMTADSIVPFNLEGWIAYNGAAPYLGTLKRLGHVITASENSAGNSAITAGAR